MPLSRQPSPSRVAVVVGFSGSAPYSTSAAVRSTSPLATLARIACCASVPKRAIGSAAHTSVGIAGKRRHVAADLAQHHAQVEEAEAEAAGRLRQRDAEQVRLGELLPRVEVVPVVGAVALLQVLETDAVLEDAAPRARASSCCSSESAKSIVSRS